MSHVLHEPSKPKIVSTTKLRSLVGGVSRCDVLVLPAIVLLGVLLRVITGPQPNDDAFITYRYVRNIVSGNGFAYNVGDPVLGTTTPLYTLILSALYFPVRAGLAWIGLAVNALADVVTIVLLWRLGLRWCAMQRWGLALVAPLLFALSPLSIAWCVATMETSLFTALLVGTMWGAVTGRARTAAIVAALAILCRPEGIIVAMLAFVVLTLKEQRLLWREALIALAVLLPWVVFATTYFGSPLPQSVTAKGGHVYIFAETGLERLKPFTRVLWDQPFGRALIRLQLGNGRRSDAANIFQTAVLLLLLGLGAWRARGAALVLLVGLPLSFNALYYWAQGQSVLIFDWYLVPLVPFYALLLGLGLSQVVEWLTARNRIAAGGLLVLCVAVTTYNALEPTNWGRSTMASPDHYRAAATLLAPRLKPTDMILAPEIGMLGYYANARIYDSVGLVSPDALRFYPVPPGELASNNAIPTRMVFAVNPEYVVSLELFIRNSLNKSDAFQKRYHLIGRVEPRTNGYGSDGLWIYARNDLAP